MKLFYSPFHTFVHKVLVTAHECGHWDRLERVATFPFKNGDGEDQGDAYDISPLNPLDKVPTLTTDQGQAIFGSQAICEYLDATATSRRMYPEPGPKRWDALSRLALSDTIFESTVQMVMEQWKPQEQWNLGLFTWLWPKFEMGLDRLEHDAARGWGEFDVGHAAMLHAISYIGFRAEFYEAKDPVHPHFDWRAGRPALSAWYDEAMTRPSVQSHYMQDFVGDSSPEKCQRAVREVLALQAANAAA
jgi:glutathione S-transferase